VDVVGFVTRLKVGDWVKVKSGGKYIFGYIAYISKNQKEAQIRKVYSIRKGKRFYYNPKNNLGTFETYRLIKLEQKLYQEDLQILIDIAIDTNDREWFMELTKRKEAQHGSFERSCREAKEVSN
jgi:IDEAL domain